MEDKLRVFLKKNNIEIITPIPNISTFEAVGRLVVGERLDGKYVFGKFHLSVMNGKLTASIITKFYRPFMSKHDAIHTEYEIISNSVMLVKAKTSSRKRKNTR